MEDIINYLQCWWRDKDNGPKKPDLFSLSGETELFQNEKGITIKIDRSRLRINC